MVHMEVVVGVCRRKRAGIVNRTTKNRVVHRLKWEEERGFFGLVLKAILEKYGTRRSRKCIV